MFRNKLALLTPIIAIAVIFIFSLTLFPSVITQTKNLPIAIVNQDQGVKIQDQGTINMGKTILEKVQNNTQASYEEEPKVKWIAVNSVDEATEGMNNQEYYASLVIPKDFSAKQASLKTENPSSPEVQIYINQGMNASVATMTNQLLSGVVDNLNNSVRTQVLTGFEEQGATITTQQASSLVTPITKNLINVNETGENSLNGNAPVSLFQPLWMGSIASAAIIFMTVNKMTINSRKEKVMRRLEQVLIGAIIALVIGFGYTWIANGMIGLDIPYFTATALFMSIASFTFYLMISAVLSLIGFGGIGIFAFMLFFGAPLLAMAPEMMSPFYQDWIYSWLPMRFLVDGLRELFYFGSGLTWDILSVLTWIAVISTIVLVATGFKPEEKQEETVES
ncbi:ABC transporter permease [Gracilibacillus caseinilyticus]|uniref:ABC transporter permease n=1 Tax=Gracilibacillus caseinilyticus TaxID=2932256 RepID=A0ABY4F3H4_9BACI|nr:ABC transporter permease [Gracilibacillus caseinilyticus]UOQ49001.1 ABC transporter permease [Gracilibacillus caseinilyticus]